MKPPFKLPRFPGGMIARHIAQQPDTALLEAIETVVEGTEPNMRLIMGYKKKLQDAVATSLAYIDELVDKIPGPLEVNHKTFISDPQVHALFATLGEMHLFFNRNPEANAFFKDISSVGIDGAYALLCTTVEEKTILGTELEGDMLRHDVMQTAVNFSDHKILSPAATEADAREGIKKCIFDGLITRALQNIVEVKSQMRNLEDQRRILHTRLRARQAQSGGLSVLLNTSTIEQTPDGDIEEKLAETEHKLKQIPASLDSPRYYLKEVKGILNHPEDFVCMNLNSYHLNQMGIKVSDDSSQSAHTIHVAKLEIADIFRFAVTIIHYPRENLVDW